MTSVIKRIVINSVTAKFLLPFALRLDNFIYRLVSRLSVLYCDGVHPKHDIIRYHKWFIENLTHTDSVLEVGSHAGAMTFLLSKHVASIVGVEIVSDLVSEARNRFQSENIKFVCGDATKCSLTEDCFDVVVMSNVLEHIEFRVQFLKKLKSNIKWKSLPRFLIRVPMITRDWVPSFKKNLGIEYRLDPTHFIEYSEAELVSELEEAGIEIYSMDIRFGEAYLVCGAII